MSKCSRTVMFFNFGSKCVARLLVAIATLKKVYNGPITVALAKNDEANGELEIILKVMGVDIIWFDFEKKVKRNLKSVLKPYLFSISPYDTTLLFDGDLIFTKPIDDLWEKIEDKGFLVTHFCGWYSNGPSMTKRINRLSKVFNEKQMKAALEKHPAVNIGVLGYNKQKGGKLLRKWEEVTTKVAGIFIADEIAMQGVYFWYDHYMDSGAYNYSCHYGKDFDKAHIIHFHGSKHSSLQRYSSRLWWGNVIELVRSSPILNLEKWLLLDPQANKVLSTTTLEDLTYCQKDWKDYLNNKVVEEDDDVLSEEDPDEG